MSLDQLLFECTLHYRDRGFPETALTHLRWVLITNTKEGRISLQTPYPSCSKKVDQLLGHFKACTRGVDQEDLTSADAVFAFAFGYRMKQWTKGLAPNDEAEVKANRLPGANNVALAEQSRQLHICYNLDLYLQFEIAAAIEVGTSVECESKCKDQSTSAVLQEFMSHGVRKGKTIRSAVVVAHRHHFDRCRLLVEMQGFRVVHPPDLYSGYDPLEAQPRAMTPEENIVNDFASMAGIA